MKVNVIAVTSFEAVRKGDQTTVELTPRIKGLIALGYLRTVEDVPLPDRPSGDTGSDSAGRSKRADRRSKSGDEPRENPDAGGLGTAEIVDPSEPESVGE